MVDMPLNKETETKPNLKRLAVNRTSEKIVSRQNLKVIYGKKDAKYEIKLSILYIFIQPFHNR